MVVLGGEPRPEALLETPEKDGGARAPVAVQLQLSAALLRRPYLADHQVNGEVVIPVVAVIDWMLAAAQGLHPRPAAHPGAAPAGGPWTVDGLDVLKGIVAEGGALPGLRLEVRPGAHIGGDGAEHAALDMLLWSESAGGPPDRPRYRGRARLGPAPSPAAPPADLPAWAGGPPYAGPTLFHGPRLRAVAGVEAGDHRGLVATLHGGAALGWSPAELHDHHVDLALLDGALQLALLWTEAALGGPSLPLGLTALCLHRPGPATGPVRATLAGLRAQGSEARCDICLTDEDGGLRATFVGVRTVLLPRR
jgi:hypothetical protein